MRNRRLNQTRKEVVKNGGEEEGGKEDGEEGHEEGGEEGQEEVISDPS